MYRTIEERMQYFFENIPDQALLITGARQTGKTYVVRKYAREHFENIVEINFIENEDAVGLFKNVRSSADILFLKKEEDCGELHYTVDLSGLTE